MRLFLASLLLLLVWPAAARAEVAIVEIAANPRLTEPNAEFVVVENTGPAPVLLDGMRLTDSARSLRGVIAPGTSLDPGQRIALQPPSGAGAYSCPAPAYRTLLSAWAQLNNDGDTVILEAGDGREVDRVAYPPDAFAAEGPSLVYDHPRARWTAGAGDATPCALPGPEGGSFRFGATELSVPESARSVTLEVLRSGGTNGSVPVPWRAVDGSALAGSDYPSSEGSVTVPAGSTRASFSVPVLDDARDEADETFTVVLGGPDAVEPTRAVVRVLDDDAPAPPVVVEPAPAAPPPVLAPVVIGTPAPPVSPAPVPPAPVPPAGTPPARTDPPRASLAVAAWQPLARTRALTAAAGCDRACDLELSGQVALGGGRVVRFARVSRRFDGGGIAPIALRLSARDARRVKRSLRSRGSLTATIVAAPVGGAAATRRVRVR